MEVVLRFVEHGEVLEVGVNDDIPYPQDLSLQRPLLFIIVKDSW